VQVLVAPAGFGGPLRATAVAAAIGRGLEAAGLDPPDLCPLADGGPGTVEVLLTRLGGESLTAGIGDRDGWSADVGFGVIGDGSAAVVELAGLAGLGPAGRPDESSWAIGELIVAAARTGVDAVLVAAGGAQATDRGVGALAAIADAGGLGGSRLVVLCPTRTHLVATGPGCEPGGVGQALARAFGGVIEPGAQLVLDAVGFDQRMRAARALIVGEGRLDSGALTGRALGEAATRARQAGVPTHAVVGVNRLDRFDARILDLQEIVEAGLPASTDDVAGVLASVSEAAGVLASRM
jgi:glycerate 2-kinase